MLLPQQDLSRQSYPPLANPSLTHYKHCRSYPSLTHHKHCRSYPLLSNPSQTLQILPIIHPSQTLYILSITNIIDRTGIQYNKTFDKLSAADCFKENNLVNSFATGLEEYLLEWVLLWAFCVWVWVSPCPLPSCIIFGLIHCFPAFILLHLLWQIPTSFFFP